ISEREISRPIDVWHAENLPHAEEAIPRDDIIRDLTTPGTPYWRLKTVMDAWCALWFWPLDKAALLDGSDDVYKTTSPATTPAPEPAPMDPDPNFPKTWEMDSLFGDTPTQPVLAAAPRRPRPKPAAVDYQRPVPLSNLDDWLDFAEALLGRQDVAANSLASNFTSLAKMAEYEDSLESAFYMHMDPVHHLGERFPWLDTVEKIAAAQGFFHWELRFASVFAEGGFDLQVGNPPWVRPRWDEDPVLAEFDPWFQLAENPSIPEHDQRKAELVAEPAARGFFVDELTKQTGMVGFFGNRSTYELMVGTQPDLYRVFMLRIWSNLAEHGVAGLIHPDTHMTGTHEGRLRAAAYRHLRLHAHFQNRRLIFPDIDWNKQFGMHVYGSSGMVNFTHVSWLFDPDPLISPLTHDGSGEAPGIKYDRTWDLRPHRKRLVVVDMGTLARWRSFSGDSESLEGY
ncbi:MAG: Eco57I restriction-modification methylase domain-containing protein, partial [Terriglobia bacterium]